MMKLETAVVTGAAGDIGKAVVERLLEDGFAVEGWDKNNEGLAENDKIFSGRPYQSRLVDLLDAEATHACVDACRAQPIRLLVNNAGGATEAVNLAAATELDLRTDIDLNLMVAWRCMKLMRQSLLNGGSVVNVSSINGTGVFGQPGYSLAKAALLHLTRFSAVELGKQGTRVNAVAPGTVRTQAWNARLEKDPEIFNRVAKWYPMRDVCVPSDISSAVSFLASQDARMITGVTLPVDGGLSAGIDAVAAEICQTDF